MSSSNREVTLRSLIPSVFLPVIMFEIGAGAVAPVLPLAALDLHVSPAVAGVVVAMLGIGRVIGNVPSAVLVNRFGDRTAMTVAAAASGLAMLMAYLAPHVLVLAVASLLMGAATATYYLARQTSVTLTVRPTMRAAALSTMGGTHRIGLFLGPFIGAAAIHGFGLRASFLVAVAASALTVAILRSVPEPAHSAAFAARPKEKTSVRGVWRAHHSLLLTLGLAIVGVGVVRAAILTVLPLWANHIGLDAQTTSVVFGIGSAVDMVLFYPAGWAMDRFGRLAVALPCMIVVGLGIMLLPLARNLHELILLTVVTFFGNGLGSGIVMTLGADVAPPESTIGFLSQWRLMTDTGNFTGPLFISAMASTFALVPAIVAAGAVGLLAAAGMARWAPRYSPFATPAMVRSAYRS